jgi:hypothetical protein
MIHVLRAVFCAPRTTMYDSEYNDLNHWVYGHLTHMDADAHDDPIRASLKRGARSRGNQLVGLAQCERRGYWEWEGTFNHDATVTGNTCIRGSVSSMQRSYLQAIQSSSYQASSCSDRKKPVQ